MPFTAPFTPHSEEDDAVHDFDTFTDPSEIEDSLKRISVARGLKRFRENHQIYQVVMAKMMGVSKRSYIDYERHGRSVPSAALAKLLAHTGLDMNVLFSGKAAPVEGYYRQQVAMQAFQLLERLKADYPEVDMKTLQEGAAIYCNYFSPSDPFNKDAMDDVMQSIFYKQQQKLADDIDKP